MATIDLSDREVYESWVTERIRFSDTDLMGHVNNVAVAAYVESGRVDYGMQLARFAPEDQRGFILARLAIDYRSELRYPGEVEVGSRVLRVGRSSYTVVTGVFDGDRCAATAEGVLVMLGPEGPAAIAPSMRDELRRRALRPED